MEENPIESLWTLREKVPSYDNNNCETSVLQEKQGANSSGSDSATKTKGQKNKW